MIKKGDRYQHSHLMLILEALNDESEGSMAKMIVLRYYDHPDVVGCDRLWSKIT